jgi:hypothetical protein
VQCHHQEFAIQHEKVAIASLQALVRSTLRRGWLRSQRLTSEGAFKRNHLKMYSQHERPILLLEPACMDIYKHRRPEKSSMSKRPWFIRPILSSFFSILQILSNSLAKSWSPRYSCRAKIFPPNCNLSSGTSTSPLQISSLTRTQNMQNFHPRERHLERSTPLPDTTAAICSEFHT